MKTATGRGATLGRVVIAWLLVSHAAAVGAYGAAPAGCAVHEGVGLGGVRLGMPVAAALAVTGPPTNQRTTGSETIYTLRAPWFQMVADYGIVQRVSTRDATCQTPRGIGVGATAAAVRQAYAGQALSVTSPVPEGELLSYPFAGVRFLIRQDRAVAIEVFRPEARGPGPATTPAPLAPGGMSPGAPTPTPTTPAGGWSVRSTSAHAEDRVFVVTGTVENRGRAQAVYAEVRLFNPSGRLVAQGDAPLFPNPVPSGRTATFEVRLPIDDVVRRFLVAIRPVGSIAGSLAESMGEVKDLQQFVAVVARQIDAAVQTSATPPTRDDFVVAVTNRSPLVVSAVTVAVEVTVSCRLAFPAPRTVQELRVGTVTVQQLRPGATARVPLALSPGACVEFVTWSATPRLGEVRIGE